MNPTRISSLPLVFVVLVACSSERKEPAVQPGLEITLPRPQAKVGEQELKVTEMQMDMRIDARGTEVKGKFTKRTEELLKVIAVDGFVVTEAEVTYKSIAETSEMAGTQEAKSDARSGKTYRLTLENGALVARAVGGPATDEELAEVVDDNDEIGVASEMDAIIASKTWRSGQPIAFTADELARVNASKRSRPGDENETVTAMELTLLSLRDEVAVFAVTMGLRLDDDRSRLEFTLKGEARVEARTGRMLELGGSGSLAGAIQRMPVKGTISMKGESRWVVAP
ncbi:MAG: hypothetical protein F9K40_15505 [Kofleriaceae bacterium]|nr:MAG: hypothetical protein F9K40_15505 [Kofleriaceae bacterium]MBZ0232187.1 hypothetical protein [Kofleriaceae bacterium]